MNAPAPNPRPGATPKSAASGAKPPAQHDPAACGCGFRLPRWNPWPVCIIAWFTLAIIGCTIFIVYCNRHPADLISEDYFEQEVRYQGHIESVAHARQSPHPATVVYDADRQLIRIVLPPEARQGKAAGDIQLYRPSAAYLDQQFKLEPDAAGVQTLDAARLLPGLWKVRASWKVGDQGYFIDQSVVIRPRV